MPRPSSPEQEQEQGSGQARCCGWILPPHVPAAAPLYFRTDCWFLDKLSWGLEPFHSQEGLLSIRGLGVRLTPSLWMPLGGEGRESSGTVGTCTQQYF